MKPSRGKTVAVAAAVVVAVTVAAAAVAVAATVAAAAVVAAVAAATVVAAAAGVAAADATNRPKHLKCKMDPVALCVAGSVALMQSFSGRLGFGRG
ncbi:MAG TPA: hypothetical protein VFE58_15330 [Tepidisphaeraceae bacterium]|nr:hypothetical protein [Tepidisphaeraceae bacterium]